MAFDAQFDGEAARPMPLDGLVGRLEAGQFDLVAVGRALLADPQWVRKVRDGSYAHIEAFDKTEFDTVY
ncbi:MAG TPA: hypothetical protein VHH11_01095 [Gammaproteobacteria bacterium]|jgi:2,4-dienoyl-CoA reductase-like NADH-dependent reductase (Old Yellow Enzyme family)|nr:hypothetical protein [Gammaproteobacteria bacterium]